MHNIFPFFFLQLVIVAKCYWIHLGPWLIPLYLLSLTIYHLSSHEKSCQ